MTDDYQILSKINTPNALKELSQKELSLLCDELRREIIGRTLENGGHLASNLGVVELTVAWHRVFHSPDDRLLFDVGHQSYVHKLLTGRREAFESLRRPGGLSGFPKREESIHDPFGTGHSGTSISAALGFAESDKLDGKRRYTAAVAGDGAFTCGMIHEAMNNCRKDLRLIIILNENEMSISRNIGAFASYLAKIRASGRYYRTKKRTENFLRHIPLFGKPLVRGIRSIKRFFKNILYSSNLFEGLGIYYFGPVDGHDLARLESIFREARDYGGCCLVHVKTKKGKGYPPAEKDPGRFHGVLPGGATPGDSFSARCSRLLCDKAEEDPSLCAITAAMAEGTGLRAFKERHPSRFFDVGIAESHAATFAAGLSAAGKTPVFAVYSTFLQRSYDSLLHDLALQGLPALICVDRAGLSSADGPTHHGIFDVAFCSQIPGAKIYAPLDYAGLERCLAAALGNRSLAFLRYSAGRENAALGEAFPYLPGEGFLRGSLAKGGAKLVILTYGRIAEEALAAAKILWEEGVPLHLLALERLKPYAETAASLLPYLGGPSLPVLFLEEGIRTGGAGLSLKDALEALEKSPARPFEILAIHESFGVQKKAEPIYTTCEISRDHLLAAARRLLS